MLFRVFFSYFLLSFFLLFCLHKKALTLRLVTRTNRRTLQRRSDKEKRDFLKKVRAKRNDFSSKTFTTRANTLRETDDEKEKRDYNCKKRSSSSSRTEKNSRERNTLKWLRNESPKSSWYVFALVSSTDSIRPSFFPGIERLWRSRRCFFF